MSSFPFTVAVGNVTVATSGDEHFPVDYWVERALEKLIYVGKDLPPEIRDQALMYRERIRLVLSHYMREAIVAHKGDMALAADKNGEKSVGEFIKAFPIK